MSSECQRTVADALLGSLIGEHVAKSRCRQLLQLHGEDVARAANAYFDYLPAQQEDVHDDVIIFEPESNDARAASTLCSRATKRRRVSDLVAQESAFAAAFKQTPERHRRSGQQQVSIVTSTCKNGENEQEGEDAASLSASSSTYTLDGAPAPFDVSDYTFSKGLESRSLWLVGTVIDCNLDDGQRVWARAQIVNIVRDQRTCALSYDIQFEDRTDVLNGVTLRFDASDRVHISQFDVRKNTPRYKRCANERLNHYVVNQLVDVKIGNRYFIGQVRSSNFKHQISDKEECKRSTRMLHYAAEKRRRRSAMSYITY